MRKEKNIAQTYREMQMSGKKNEDVTLGDKMNIEWANDPVFLSRELNKELSEMRDEMNEHMTKIRYFLILISVLLVAILLSRVI
jgi:hypothetical protein